MRIRHAGGHVAHGHHALSDLDAGGGLRDAGHLAHSVHRLLETGDVVDVDLIAVLEGIAWEQVKQLALPLPLGLKVRQHRLPVYELHLTNIVQRCNAALEGLGLLQGIAVVHIGGKLVLGLKGLEVLVQVHRDQRKRAHDQQARHDHSHRREGQCS